MLCPFIVHLIDASLPIMTTTTYNVPEARDQVQHRARTTSEIAARLEGQTTGVVGTRDVRDTEKSAKK